MVSCLVVYISSFTRDFSTVFLVIVQHMSMLVAQLCLLHFTSFCSVQLAFAFVVYPCLVIQYMGQAAFLSKNLGSIPNSFYNSIPGLLTMTPLSKITCFLEIMTILYDFGPLCRSCSLACLCHCHACSHCWQSGCDNRYVLNNQTMPCSWLLPTR